MPPVVVLWCQALNRNRATIKLFRQVCVIEELLHSKAVAFDPVFRGQIDGRIGCQPTVCDTAHNLVVVGLVDRPRIRPQLTAKKLIEVLVLCWIRFFQLTERVFQVEALSRLLILLTLLPPSRWSTS